MTATCPQGHTSATDDFCDVCGTPIEVGSASAGDGAGGRDEAKTLTLTPPAGAQPLAAPAPKECPHCQAANLADALFCEDCGYDFATGQLPPPPAAIDPTSGVLVPPAGARQPAAADPPELTGVDWVAEVWVDPEWFASQQAEGTAPAAGLPTVVALPGPVALVGRRSKSQGVNPEVDCSGDSAVSHRHAELSLANDQWSVKDLGSTNGTYVGEPGGSYPSDPLPAQEQRLLADDERVYLGGWTRIVVRRATAEEKA